MAEGTLLEQTLTRRIERIVDLAHALDIERRDEDAERLFKQAILICDDKWPQNGNHQCTVRACRMYGDFFVRRTEFSSAQPLFERAVEICFALKDSKRPAPLPVTAQLYGQVLCDLGYCYWQVVLNNSRHSIRAYVWDLCI